MKNSFNTHRIKAISKATGRTLIERETDRPEAEKKEMENSAFFDSEKYKIEITQI